MIPENSLTQKRLKKILHYNPLTGLWKWRVSLSNRVVKNSQAGSINGIDKYRKIRIDKRNYQSSRLAFLYMEGYFPENYIDHKNRIRDDDRWENLRHVSQSCNLRNAKILLNNTSGIKGIYWSKADKKWFAHITVMGKQTYLGLYSDLLEAAAVRFCAEQCLKWPNCDTNSSSGNYLKTYLKTK